MQKMHEMMRFYPESSTDPDLASEFSKRTPHLDLSKVDTWDLWEVAPADLKNMPANVRKKILNSDGVVLISSNGRARALIYRGALGLPSNLQFELEWNRWAPSCNTSTPGLLAGDGRLIHRTGTTCFYIIFVPPRTAFRRIRETSALNSHTLELRVSKLEKEFQDFKDGLRKSLI
jgi:hypothetical protein